MCEQQQYHELAFLGKKKRATVFWPKCELKMTSCPDGVEQVRK